MNCSTEYLVITSLMTTCLCLSPFSLESFIVCGGDQNDEYGERFSNAFLLADQRTILIVSIFKHEFTHTHTHIYIYMHSWVTSWLEPGRSGRKWKSMIFKLIMQNSSLNTHCEIARRWTPQYLSGNQLTLVKVMAWCHQTTSHYLSKY